MTISTDNSAIAANAAVKAVTAGAAAAPAPATHSVAPVVTAALDAAAPEAVAAAVRNGGLPRSALLATGVATIATVGLSAWNIYKDSIGKQLNPSSGPFWIAGTAAVSGAAMLTLGQTARISPAWMQSVLRYGGATLVTAGLGGAVLGAAGRSGRFGGTAPVVDPREQRSVQFAPQLPSSPSQLEGMTVGWGSAVDKSRKPVDADIYIDTSTARELPAATTLSEAVGEAHLQVQQDRANLAYRSQAVLQMKDGTYWTARLSGDLDQVDGRGYTSGNQLDPLRTPTIGKRQPALQAIVGVEHVYVFPKDGEASQAAPLGAVPWLDPASDTTGSTKA